MSITLPPEPSGSDPILASWGRNIIRYLKSITLQSSPDFIITNTANGTTIRFIKKIFGTGGGSVSDDPVAFDITFNSSTNEVTLWPGTLNGALPTNMFSTFTYTPATTSYIKVAAVTNGRAVTSSSIVLNTSAPTILSPTQGTAPTSFDVLIGVIVNGTVYKTWGGGNIEAISNQTLIEEKASPTPGLSPFNYYWTWNISVES